MSGGRILRCVSRLLSCTTSFSWGSIIVTLPPFPHRVLSFSSCCAHMIARSSDRLSFPKRDVRSSLPRLPRLSQHPSNVPSSFIHPDSTSKSQSTSTPPSVGTLMISVPSPPPNTTPPLPPIGHWSCRWSRMGGGRREMSSGRYRCVFSLSILIACLVSWISSVVDGRTDDLRRTEWPCR
jgi:hypothetical protein